MFKKVLALLAIATSTPALAADEIFPYLFTQGHNGTKQVVRKLVPLQIQLPAGPTHWEFAPGESKNADLTDAFAFNSPGRIAGTSKIQSFNFEIRPDEAATIVLITKNLAPVLKSIVPNGRYELTVVPK